MLVWASVCMSNLCVQLHLPAYFVRPGTSALSHFLRCLNRLLNLIAHCASVSLTVNEGIELYNILLQATTDLFFDFLFKWQVKVESRREVQSLENYGYAQRKKSHYSTPPQITFFSLFCMHPPIYILFLQNWIIKHIFLYNLVFPPLNAIFWISFHIIKHNSTRFFFTMARYLMIWICHNLFK